MPTMQKTMVTPGERILALRAFFGLTQTEFAEKTTISLRSICNYEAGTFNPRPEIVDRIEAAFNIELDTMAIRLDYEKCKH